MARLQQYYVKEVVPALKEKRKYTNPHQVPRIVKIVLNVGLGEGAQFDVRHLGKIFAGGGREVRPAAYDANSRLRADAIGIIEAAVRLLIQDGGAPLVIGGERIEHAALDGALQRPRAIQRIEPHLRHLRQRRVADVELHVLRGEPLLEALQLDLRDRGDVLLVEGVEHHDLAVRHELLVAILTLSPELLA